MVKNMEKTADGDSLVVLLWERSCRAEMKKAFRDKFCEKDL